MTEMKIIDDIKTQMERRYLNNGADHCPVCGSEKIGGTGIKNFGDDWATNEIKCDNCGSIWDDVYTLTGCDIKEVNQD